MHLLYQKRNMQAIKYKKLVEKEKKEYNRAKK
jgi:hypothetical protein